MSIAKRILRVLKWAGIGLVGLVTILLIVNAIAVWITGSQVERRLAAIRAAGDPISITDFHTEAIPPEKDAASYLRRAKSDAKSLSTELAPIAENIHERTTYLDDAEIKAIESSFAAYPKVIPLLERAANCPFYSVYYGEDAVDTSNTINVFTENTEQKRMFARILYRWRFFLLLSKNKHEEAVRNCITLLKLCRLIEKDPATVNFLVNVACREIAIRCANEALQSGRVSDNTRQELENELAKIDMRRAYLQAMKSERAFVLDNFEEMRRLMPWYSHVFLNRQTIGCLDVLDWLIARATAALPENAANPPANILPTPPSSGVLGQLLLPALQAAETAANRVEAEIRVIRVINALGRRNDPEKSPLPDLSDLGLPTSATTDPFSDSGQPLIVKKVDGGWLVYSVGVNKVDDGGELDDSHSLDIGLRPVIRTKAVAP